MLSVRAINKSNTIEVHGASTRLCSDQGIDKDSISDAVRYNVQGAMRTPGILTAGLIRAIDVHKVVSENMSQDKKSIFEVSQDSLMRYARDVTEKERPLVATQLAIFQKIAGSNNPSEAVAMFKVLSPILGASLVNKGFLPTENSKTFFSDLADDVMTYLDTHEYDADSNTFKNDSGLTMSLPETFCTMNSERHVIMRALPKLDTVLANQPISGKPYADYLVSDTDKGKGVFKLGGKKDAPSSHDYDVAFSSHPRFFQHVIKALTLNSMLEQKKWLQANPDQSKPKLHELAEIKPNLVATAEHDSAHLYLAKSSFTAEGKWHLTIPEAVVKQLPYSPKHDLNDVDTKKKFLFTQELGTGNILLSVHLDRTFHHSTPFGGRPLATAGILEGTLFEEGGQVKMKVDTYVNNSGHYHPSLESMGELRKALIASGLGVGQLKFEAVSGLQEDSDDEDDPVDTIMAVWNSSHESPPIPSNFSTENSILINKQRAWLDQEISQQLTGAVNSDSIDQSSTSNVKRIHSF